MHGSLLITMQHLMMQNTNAIESPTITVCERESAFVCMKAIYDGQFMHANGIGQNTRMEPLMKYWVSWIDKYKRAWKDEVYAEALSLTIENIIEYEGTIISVKIKHDNVMK